MTAVQDRPIRPGRRGTGDDEWPGPWRRYDIVKEFVIATAVVAVLTVLLAVIFSSPDERPITLQGLSLIHI